MTVIVAVDCETTGLSLYDDIWEFAAIRREPDGTETTAHLFIEHDTRKCFELPESFRADHRARFPISKTQRWHPDVVSRKEAAHAIHQITSRRHEGEGKPHIVGAVPNFDTERIALLLDPYGLVPDWHHRLRCAETLTAGHLGREAGGLSECAQALGIAAPEAHTAMGDARTALAIWDRVMTNE